MFGLEIAWARLCCRFFETGSRVKVCIPDLQIVRRRDQGDCPSHPATTCEGKRSSQSAAHDAHMLWKIRGQCVTQARVMILVKWVRMFTSGSRRRGTTAFAPLKEFQR